MGNKKILIIGAILLTVGLLIFFATMVVIGFDFDKLSNLSESKEEIKEDFDNIFIDLNGTNVTVKPSIDGCCQLETKTEKGVTIEHTVLNGELKIQEKKDKKRT